MIVKRFAGDRAINNFKHNWKIDQSYAIKALIEMSISEKAQPSYATRGFVYPIEIDIKDLKEL